MTDQGPREIRFERASGEWVDILVGLVRDYYALDGIAFAADDVRRALRSSGATRALAPSMAGLASRPTIAFR